MTHESSARIALAELAQGRTQDEYIALVWAQRYPNSSSAASTGWPFKHSEGIEQPSKLRKIK
jgi:hypothetical protein